ncbi:MAG: hypothetical protein AAFZ92_05570 [Pseudomonadota bacterium]
MSKERIKRIQKKLQLSADGIIGPATLSAIESEILGRDKASAASTLYSLTLSQKGFQQLIDHEISSRTYYQRRLQQPIWPGGASGVTIGIGYDLGYNRRSQVRKDWAPYLSDAQLEKLIKVVGKKASAAKSLLASVKGIRIDYQAAARVFSESTLPRYAKKALQTYQGLEKLYPDAQAGILSLVYNRGTRLSGAKRKEMKAIQQLVKKKDYKGIAHQVIAMKRLWQDYRNGIRPICH